jgi:hypothetical protein
MDHHPKAIIGLIFRESLANLFELMEVEQPHGRDVTLDIIQKICLQAKELA